MISFNNLPEKWQQKQIASLAKASFLRAEEDQSKKYTSFTINNITLNIDISASVDIEFEISRIKGKIKEFEKSLKISKERLSNDKFIKNADQEVIDQETNNLNNLTDQIQTLEKLLKRLS